MMKQARMRIALGLATVGALMAGIAWYNSREAEQQDGWVPVNEWIAAALATPQATPAPPQPTPTPAQHEPESSPQPTPQEVPDEPADSRLNLNEATVSQLEQLPGIGPSKAQAIVAYREQHGKYRSVDQLLEVKGIGPKILEKLSPEIYVR